jgi:DNA (cytosine-5)-methyltransferase 1
MGFPDTFKIPVSDMRAYKQFGNSVVVPVMTAVAEAMRTHLVVPSTTEQKSRQRKV